MLQPEIWSEEADMKWAIFLLCFLSGFAQITNTYYVQGDSNRITASDSVNKATKDLFDVAGSAYGNAETNQK